MVRVENAKLAKEEAKKRVVDSDATSTTTADEIRPENASAAMEAELKAGQAAAVTNPPVKAKKKGATGKGKAAGKKKARAKTPTKKK